MFYFTISLFFLFIRIYFCYIYTCKYTKHFLIYQIAAIK